MVRLIRELNGVRGSPIPLVVPGLQWQFAPVHSFQSSFARLRIVFVIQGVVKALLAQNR